MSNSEDQAGAGKRSAGRELDTPYFRRSFMQGKDASLELLELRIDHFLHEEGIIYVEVDQHHDFATVAKNLNLIYATKRTSGSELPDDSRKSSLSSFNLESNTLFLRRKVSVNQPPVGLSRESAD